MLRKGTGEPTCRWSKTIKLGPGLAKLRNGRRKPKWAKSSTGSKLPAQAGLLANTLDPEFTWSRTGSEDREPDLMRPGTKVDGSVLVKLREGTREPTCR